MVASFSTLATRRRSVRRLAVLLMCACALPVSAARAWTWPVDGPVLRPFSFDHAHPYAGGQHRGVDLGAPGGAQGLAPAAGVVSFAGPCRRAERPCRSRRRSGTPPHSFTWARSV